jgi:hypothetical protein
MKKPQLKTDDKGKVWIDVALRKTPENGLRNQGTTIQYTTNYNSAQNLRPNLVQELEPSSKNDRNTRRPEFLRNMVKTNTVETVALQ